ncbi:MULTISPECIES: hypothetical protein [Rhizobium/Agrobacterium group]|uniref:hypothetical protein n=1 Tax=Rhizobium/Agrobacterium group TaxID=227290 RepID=UPI0012E718C9|nr:MULTISPECIES: hypothetical protein [Rhizobium/Agrobacterium group]NSZ77375.1 hypothetical protein [Agrobacterium tumefaciens]MCR6727999.1 hypothetical protein [Agrobacterium fabrum]MVA53091.1 hypothetical protein [Agrobacterium vitis]MVA63225.1 hypothetical protein [Agrobacterium vitis]NTG45520.1 hypothetical protein [Rhizobium rhizogenes]
MAQAADDPLRLNCLFFFPPRMRGCAGATRIAMVIGKNDVRFKSSTEWAINRAEEIVSAQELDLLRSTSEGRRWSTDYCVMRLTIAIIEALNEGRNFEQARSTSF